MKQPAQLAQHLFLKQSKSFFTAKGAKVKKEINKGNGRGNVELQTTQSRRATCARRSIQESCSASSFCEGLIEDSAFGVKVDRMVLSLDCDGKDFVEFAG